MTISASDGDWAKAEVAFSPTRLTLSVGARSVPLDRRSAHLLRHLTEHFGQVVSKDELMGAGWPGRTVLENSLVKAVAKLRGHLDGSRLEIATIHGYGYELREVNHDDTSRSGTEAQTGEASIARRPLLLLALALGISALGAATIGLFAPQTTGREEVPLRTTAPETIDGPAARGIVLWVDDKPNNNTLDVIFLRNQNVAVHLARSTEEAMALLAIKEYDLIISDLGRAEDRLAGLHMIGDMKAARHDVPVLIYTIRPDDPRKQLSQNAMVREAGAAGLAVTPAEVREKSLKMLGLEGPGARR